MRIGFDAKRYYLNATGLGNYSRDLIRMLETYYSEHTYYKYSPKVPDQPLHNSNLTSCYLACGEIEALYVISSPTTSIYSTACLANYHREYIALE